MAWKLACFTDSFSLVSFQGFLKGYQCINKSLFTGKKSTVSHIPGYNHNSSKSTSRSASKPFLPNQSKPKKRSNLIDKIIKRGKKSGKEFASMKTDPKVKEH